MNQSKNRNICFLDVTKQLVLQNLALLCMFVYNISTQKFILFTGLQKTLYFAETSEDISPYATFQLSETLPQNTMLHSFMYHEHPMTEGCASTPPALSTMRVNSSCYDMVYGFFFFFLMFSSAIFVVNLLFGQPAAKYLREDF